MILTTFVEILNTNSLRLHPGFNSHPCSPCSLNTKSFHSYPKEAKISMKVTKT